jgi:ribosomal protein S18 acetylase RimI-like enzyme
MGGPQDLLADQPELAAGLTIRQTRPEDDADYARLLSLVMTAAYDVDALRERRERYAHKQWHVRVAEVDGSVAGVAELVQSGAGAFAMCRIVVDPEMRRKGIGSSLLREVANHPLYGSRKVFAQTPDDDESAVRFVERAGFVREAHVFESFIDPGEFDIAPYLPMIEGVKSGGLRIATLAELGASLENLRKVFDLETTTDQDIPGLDLDHLPSWEDAKRTWYQARWYDPAAEFIALDGEQFVGASAVAEMAPGTWSILHTCTLRDYRERGIGTALKALATDYAKQRGSRVLKTNNHSGNDAMLSINRRFGFQPMPGWLEYTKFSD